MGKRSRRGVWQDFEIEDMKRYFPDHFTRDLCEWLKRPYSSIACKAMDLNLKKSETFKAKLRAIEAQRLLLAGKNTRFQPGCAPHNKGRRISAAWRDQLEPTMFKKGHTPHNTKPDGYRTLRRDGYYWIRINGRFVQEHRYIYEQARGPLPAKSRVRFIDGDPSNLNIDNLEAITLKKLMERNTIARFTPELTKTIKLSHKLIRIINGKK